LCEICPEKNITIEKYSYFMTDTFTVLRKLINLFEKNNIYHIIGGNTGLILRNVEVKDDKEIDICTDKTGAYKIQKLLDKYCIDEVKYKRLEWFKAHWGIFKINNITIEIMGNPKRKFEDGSWRGLPKKNITTTIFRNKTVNVFTLKSEYEYYGKASNLKFKKKKIAEAIKKML